MNGVRAKREQMEISQTELALMCGLEPSLISLIERGKRCSKPTADRIAKALGTKAADVFVNYHDLRDW